MQLIHPGDFKNKIQFYLFERSMTISIFDRVLYFGYVLLTTFKHKKKLITYCRYYEQKYAKSYLFFLKEAYIYYIKYDMHPLDYFYYNVYDNKEFNTSEHANTLFMYCYHKIMNDRKSVKYFHNKMLFHYRFKNFMGHDFLALKDIDEIKLTEWILSHSAKKFIIKRMKSVGGFGVKKINTDIIDGKLYVNTKPLNAVIDYLRSFDMIEEFVEQHELLNRLNPSCLNTIRIVTVRDSQKKVNIIGATIRLGVNNDVDNFHSGGIAVNIDVQTGILNGYGFRLAPSDKVLFDQHPITNVKLNGYQLPNWDILKEVVRNAALVIPEARTIGWDIAITDSGVTLIEGNHDWDKIIIEKALKRGIRCQLESFI